MVAQKEIRRETTVKETTIETIIENSCENANIESVQKLLEECQGFQYAQSSNFSQLSRTLVFSVLGTIWVVSYSDQGFIPSNNFLIWALIVGFAYLVVDVCHYFFDSRFYKKEYFKFEKEKNISQHDSRMSKRSQLSYRAIWGKFIILIVICVLFIIGFVKQYDVISIFLN